MGGKVTNAQVLAIIARQKPQDIATTEGHDIVPTEEELAKFMATLGPDEDPFRNRHLETPTKSRNIKGFFRKESE